MSKRLIAVCIATLLCIHTALLTYSAKVHSPTWDEVGHLAAGMSHWELGRFELYSVNPPLVRTIAAAPVYFFGDLKMDWELYDEDPKARSEVYVGRRMVDIGGEDSLQYFFWARLAVLPIALLGACLCYLWGAQLFGTKAGLLAMGLWVFSPNVNAYGSVITPDMASAVALLGCCYVFYRWISAPSFSGGFLLAVSLALAMLVKSVWLVLPPVFMALAITSDLCKGRSERNFALVGKLVGVAVTALLIVNVFYGFAGSFKPLGNYQFCSSILSGASDSQPDSPGLERGEITESDGSSRFAGTLISQVPVPLPENYLQGIDIQTRDFERGTYDVRWKSYLMGQWQQGGWWYFYAVGLLAKVPLPLWMLFGLGCWCVLFSGRFQSEPFALACLLVPTLTLFVIVSAATGLNRYVRYALPVLPALFVIASASVLAMDAERRRFKAGQFKFGIQKLLVAGCCFWLVLTTAFHSPNHLGYFNELARLRGTPEYWLCDSNVDWGQDLIRLKKWLASNSEAAEDLHLAYFGPVDPNCVGIKYSLPFHPQSLLGEIALPTDGPGNGAVLPGWHVISRNYLVGHSMPVPDSHNPIFFRSLSESKFDFFRSLDPVGTIGSGLVVFHVAADWPRASAEDGAVALQPVQRETLSRVTEKSPDSVGGNMPTIVARNSLNPIDLTHESI